MALRFQFSSLCLPILKDDQIIGFNSGWRTIHFKNAVNSINEILQQINQPAEINNAKSHTDQAFSAKHDDILLYLYELGFLELKEAQSLPWNSYHEHTLATGRAIRHAMLQKQGLDTAPNLNKETLLRSLFESYHIINSAVAHIMPALENDLSFEELSYLDDYLEEERWHGQFLYYGLRKAGISEEKIQATGPLKETQNLISFLSQLAKDDFTSYSLCISITESPSNSPGYIKQRLREWKRMEDLNLIPRDALKVFRQHEEADLAFGHGDFSKNFTFKNEFIEPEHQKSIEKIIIEFISLQGAVYKELKKITEI